MKPTGEFTFLELNDTRTRLLNLVTIKLTFKKFK